MPYEDKVLEEVAHDLSSSVGKVEKRTGISKSIAHRVLKKQLHSYQMQRVQNLLPKWVVNVK